jgi:hypothetical protein
MRDPSKESPQSSLNVLEVTIHLSPRLETGAKEVQKAIDQEDKEAELNRLRALYDGRGGSVS